MKKNQTNKVDPQTQLFDPSLRSKSDGGSDQSETGPLAVMTPAQDALRHPVVISNKEQRMPEHDGLRDRSTGYGQAREWLISAAVQTVLDHCSEEDRDRLRLVDSSELQASEALIPEFSEEANQHADLVVQQAIATISMLITKEYSIRVLK
jgi:hypothetical protein